MPRKRVVVSLAALAFLAVAGALIYATVGNPLNPFDDAQFTPSRWASTADDGRAPMAQDLVQNHLSVGMMESQVTGLLGKPDGLCQSGNYGRLRSGTHCMYYMIGNWSYHGMDQALVIVHFDAQGQSTGAEVYGE
jgi:hypothetical protein